MILGLIKQLIDTMALQDKPFRLEIKTDEPEKGRYECRIFLAEQVRLSLLLSGSDVSELIALLVRDPSVEAIELPFKEQGAEVGQQRPDLPPPPDQNEVDLSTLKEEFVDRFFESARLLSRFDARITDGPMSIQEVMERIINFFWYESADPFAEEYDPPTIRNLVMTLCNTRARNRLIQLLEMMQTRKQPLVITNGLLKSVLSGQSRS